jgi:hypothetical protein
MVKKTLKVKKKTAGGVTDGLGEALRFSGPYSALSSVGDA